MVKVSFRSFWSLPCYLMSSLPSSSALSLIRQYTFFSYTSAAIPRHNQDSILLSQCRLVVQKAQFLGPIPDYATGLLGDLGPSHSVCVFLVGPHLYGDNTWLLSRDVVSFSVCKTLYRSSEERGEMQGQIISINKTANTVACYSTRQTRNVLVCWKYGVWSKEMTMASFANYTGVQSPGRTASTTPLSTSCCLTHTSFPSCFKQTPAAAGFWSFSPINSRAHCSLRKKIGGRITKTNHPITGISSRAKKHIHCWVGSGWKNNPPPCHPKPPHSDLEAGVLPISAAEGTEVDS